MPHFDKDLFENMTRSAHLFEERQTSTYAPQAAWSGPFCPPNRQAYRPYIAYLCTQILLGHTGLDIRLDHESRNRRTIAELMGVPEVAQKKLQPARVREALLRAHGSGTFYPANQAVIEVADCPLKRNLDWIVHTAQLSPVEARVFELAVMVRAFPSWEGLLCETGECSVSDHYYAIAALLQLDPLAVKDAMKTDSLLLRCALVSQWNHGGCRLDHFLRAPKSLAHKMEHHTGDPSTLLHSFLLPLQDSPLKLEDFGYTQANTQLAQAWLAGALASAARQQGSGHLLVSGAPGLGKTEWVRALLHQARTQAMELAVFAESGAPLSGSDRLRNLMMCMHFMQHTLKGVLVFDEADDIFGYQSDSMGGKGDDDAVDMRTHRASLNQLLERSRLPVVWIMNEPGVLDPAVLRRFDAVIQFEPMSRIPKRKLLEVHFQQGSDPLPPTELDRWAELMDLTPALIARLSTVRRRALDAELPMDLDDCRQWLVQRLSQKSNRVLRSVQGQEPPWSAQTVNASVDLAALTEGIQNYPHARVLLYGLPGTGKTAYAHALAKALGKPLMERRASDLLSAYVGGTEALIHAAFEQAHADDVVLFLDEADSLLASRDSATRNWEVTQVNELLVQLHAFEGVVVLATNRLDHLDAALLRRMDAKVEFLPLELHQSVDLLMGVLVAARDGQPLESFTVPAQDMTVLSHLHPLTPGDFAVLRRRLRFAPMQAKDPVGMAREAIALLALEVRHKTGGKQAMGFTSSSPLARDVHNTPKDSPSRAA